MAVFLEPVVGDLLQCFITRVPKNVSAGRIAFHGWSARPMSCVALSFVCASLRSVQERTSGYGTQVGLSDPPYLKSYTTES